MCPPTPASSRRRSSGPVAPITGFDTEEEGIAAANDTEYGLAAYIYTRDLDRALRVAEGVEAGMVGVNRGVISDAGRAVRRRQGIRASAAKAVSRASRSTSTRSTSR